LARKSKRHAAAAVIAAALLSLTHLGIGAEQAPRPVNPYAGNAEAVAEGKGLFNQYCSHCHGPDAVQGERPRDLRRLQIRYGDDAIVVFYATINNGRMEKGMPIWKGVLNEDVMWKIFTFLSSIQSEP
jgi:mono/diheme cytochrome c family protein